MTVSKIGGMQERTRLHKKREREIRHRKHVLKMEARARVEKASRKARSIKRSASAVPTEHTTSPPVKNKRHAERKYKPPVLDMRTYGEKIIDEVESGAINANFGLIGTVYSAARNGSRYWHRHGRKRWHDI